MTHFRSAISCVGLFAAAFLISGCQNILGGTPPSTSGFEPPVDLRQKEIDERKDESIRQLAHCESGGSGPSDRPIYGGRGAYLGRLQFATRTVMAYVQKRDGIALNPKDAAALALDYDRAADLAKYMIFDLEEPWHWPLCSKKVNAQAEIAALKQI